MSIISEISFKVSRKLVNAISEQREYAESFTVGFGNLLSKNQYFGKVHVVSIARKCVLRLLLYGPIQFFVTYLRFLSRSFGWSEVYAEGIYHKLNSLFKLTVEREGLVFDASFKTPASRANRLYEKEPDLIFWLDNYLKPEDTFYDVGANVGIYSLYAALRCQTVIAFEPESSNYAILNRNIYLNSMEDKIVALNLALHNREILSTLAVSNIQPGKSGHMFNEKITDDVQHSAAQYKQTAIGAPLDLLIHRYQLDVPNLIKIDVDGNENIIIDGMRNTIQDRRLRSVAIEINSRLEVHSKIFETMSNLGFTVIKDTRLINKAYQDIGVENYYFVRKI